MASFGILNLPYELIEYILQSRVSRDSKGDSRDKETERFLGACRLTCRVLDCIAAPMLFQSLQLGSVSDWHDPGTLDRVHAFHNLLRENQKISTYIHSCSIITNDCHTFFQSPDIAVILSQLRQLRHFSLRVYAIRPKLWWSQVTESQAAAFKGICSLPSLTSLEFRGIHDLPLLQLLEHSTNLGELTLRHIYLDLDAYGSCPPTFKLQSLRLINVKTPTSRFQSFKLHEIPAFRSLERLQIYFSSRESIEQARMILEVTQQTIRELHFLPWHTIDSDDNWKDHISFGFYLHPLPSLEKITIEESSGWHASGHLPPYISTLLDLHGPSSTVKHVHVYTNAPYNTVENTRDAWRELDRILREKHPALKLLTLECNDHTFPHDDPKQVRGAIETIKPLFEGVIGTLGASVRLRVNTVMTGWRGGQRGYIEVV